MSWSFQAIGIPTKIADAIEAESAKMSGQSKVEFDDAKPHIMELVRQNFVGNDQSPALVKVTAHGSGISKTLDDGQVAQISRSCSVSIEAFHAKLLV